MSLPVSEAETGMPSLFEQNSAYGGGGARKTPPWAVASRIRRKMARLLLNTRPIMSTEQQRTAETGRPGQDARRPGRSLERMLLLVILAAQLVVVALLLRPAGRDMFRTADTDAGQNGRQAVDRPETNASWRPFVQTDDEIDRLMRTLSPQTTRRPIPDDSDRMHRQFSRMFEMAAEEIERFNSLVDIIDAEWDSVGVSPTMDMREQDDRYVVAFSLPGFHHSDVTVTLEDRLLTVAGIMRGHVAGSSRRFERKVLLPGPIGDAELVRASITNQILRISLPKAQATAAPGGKFRLL